MLAAPAWVAGTAMSQFDVTATECGVDAALPVGARVMFDGEDEALALDHDAKLFVAEMKTARGAMIDTGKERCCVFVTPGEVSGMAAPGALTCFREPQLAS